MKAIRVFAATVSVSIVAVLIVVLAILSLVCPSQGHAQSVAPSTPKPSPPGVRVVNFRRILENYKRVQRRLKALKAEAAESELLVSKELKSQQDELDNLGRLLEVATPHTEDARAMELEMACRESVIRHQLELCRREFVMQETKITAATYREIHDEVRMYCKYEGVSLVLRSDDEGELSDGGCFMKAPNLDKFIVYADPSIDISDFILGELNRWDPGDSPQRPSGSAVPRPLSPQPAKP